MIFALAEDIVFTGMGRKCALIAAEIFEEV
jgi:hypothetical protein